MMFVVFSSLFILVTSDLDVSTRSRDVNALPSAASESQGKDVDTVFTKERTLAGKPESRYTTNQGLSSSRNISRSCACSPNKQIGNTLDSAAKVFECPCLEPVRQNIQVPDNKSSVYHVGETVRAQSKNDVKRLIAYTGLPGLHSPPYKHHGMKYGRLGEKNTFPRLPRSTLNVDSEDSMDQGYNFLEAIQHTDDENADNEEASLIRLLDGEQISLEEVDNPNFQPYDIHMDFNDFYPNEDFRNGDAENFISRKFFHPMLKDNYLKALETHTSSTPHRDFHKNLQPPFTDSPSQVSLDVLPNHVTAKRESLSRLDINRLKQVSGDTCRLKLLDHMIAVPGCAVRFIKVTTCHGSCHSSNYPQWGLLNAELHESCTCCGNASVEPRVFRLKCLRKPNGEFFVRINNPVKCICRPCDNVPQAIPEKPYNY